MSTTYRPVDPPIVKMAERIVAKEHTHLLGVHIEYVFRSEHAKTGGKEVLGKARKITGLTAFLCGEDEGDEVEPFFVIELAEDLWVELSMAQQAALLDHELSHCGVKVDDDGESKLVTLPHDLEEFSGVVSRHGLWRDDIKHFAKTCAEQLDLLAELDEGKAE